MTVPRNLCSSCGRDFSGLETFDQHRVGTHDYTYAEGLAMEPMVEDGRRCMTADELAEAGIVLAADGFWRNERRAARARRFFVKAPPGSAEAA